MQTSDVLVSHANIGLYKLSGLAPLSHRLLRKIVYMTGGPYSRLCRICKKDLKFNKKGDMTMVAKSQRHNVFHGMIIRLNKQVSKFLKD